MSGKFLGRLSNIFKGMLFVALCFALSFAIIFPLWFFASSSPYAYSFVVCVCFGAILAWQVFRAAKRLKARRLACILAKLAVTSAGLFSAFFFLARMSRLLFVVSLVAMVVLLFLADTVFKRK